MAMDFYDYMEMGIKRNREEGTNGMDKLDRFVAQLPVAVRRGWKDAFRIQRPPAAVVSLEPAICAAIIRAVTELARECEEVKP